MTTKPKKKPEQPKNNLEVPRKKDEPDDKAIARAMMRPSVQGAITIRKFEGEKEANLMGFVDELSEQAEAVNNGDMTRAEEMLIVQAHTLNELFNNLARRSHGQEYMKNLEIFMRLALKAQAQCTRTLEVLAAIKNPPVVFAKQANINNGGNQQVNNGGMPAADPRACEGKTIQSNELLEVKDGERLDTGATSATSGTDKELATLGEIDGAKDTRRESASG